MRKYNFDFAMEGENAAQAAEFMQALQTMEMTGAPRRGAIVEGEVVVKNKDYFVIHIPGTKSGGLVETKEGADLQVGDQAAFWVLANNGFEEPVILSRQKAIGWQKLLDLSESDEMVEARVFSLAMGRRDRQVYGLRIIFDNGDLKDLRGFVPRSEIPRGTNFEDYLDTIVKVKILSAEPERGKQFGSMVASIKFIEEKDRLELVSTLEPGDIVEGTVKKVIKLKNGNSRGAIIDLDNGLAAFIHETQVSGFPHVKIDSVLTTGLKRKFAVSRVDSKSGKVSLSSKSLDRQELLASLSAGAVFSGRVASIESFGYFVDLGGLCGLLHWSQLKDGENMESFKQGDSLEVAVLSVKEDGSRLALGRKTL
ncbi:MAG: S1 RNA-binding domain-containing protein [Candidatus Obscuribacterales bacterium]